MEKGNIFWLLIHNFFFRLLFPDFILHEPSIKLIFFSVFSVRTFFLTRN